MTAVNSVYFGIRSPFIYHLFRLTNINQRIIFYCFINSFLLFSKIRKKIVKFLTYFYYTTKLGKRQPFYCEKIIKDNKNHKNHFKRNANILFHYFCLSKSNTKRHSAFPPSPPLRSLKIHFIQFGFLSHVRREFYFCRTYRFRERLVERVCFLTFAIYFIGHARLLLEEKLSRSD